MADLRLSAIEGVKICGCFSLVFPCLDNLIRVFMIEKETKIKTRCELILRFPSWNVKYGVKLCCVFVRSIKNGVKMHVFLNVM